MIEILFKPSFIKQMNKLEKELAEEVIEKIELLKNPVNHVQLKVHKLHGRLSSFFSFSVNYKVRVVFEYTSKDKKQVVLLVVDDHDLYK